MHTNQLHYCEVLQAHLFFSYRVISSQTKPTNTIACTSNQTTLKKVHRVKAAIPSCCTTPVCGSWIELMICGCYVPLHCWHSSELHLDGGEIRSCNLLREDGSNEWDESGKWVWMAGFNHQAFNTEGRCSRPSRNVWVYKMEIDLIRRSLRDNANSISVAFTKQTESS